MFETEPDLFEAPALAGFNYAGDIVSAQEEQELIARIDASELAPFRFQGWIGKRLTASYGWSYDFDSGRLGPAPPFPRWLMPLREKAADFARLSPGELAQALLIRYDPGAGIGWHRDRPVFDEVIGISLGAPATLRFRKRVAAGFERRSAQLERKSIYHLTCDARHAWEHSIAPIDRTRWSITFRTLAVKRGGHQEQHARSEKS